MKITGHTTETNFMKYIKLSDRQHAQNKNHQHKDNRHSKLICIVVTYKLPLCRESQGSHCIQELL